MLLVRNRMGLSLLLATTLMLGCSGKVETSSAGAAELCAMHGSQPFRLTEATFAHSLTTSKLGLAWTEGTIGHRRVRLLSLLGEEPKTIAESAGVEDAFADDDAIWWLDATGTVHRTAPDGQTRAVATLDALDSLGLGAQSRGLLFVTSRGQSHRR